MVLEYPFKLFILIVVVIVIISIMYQFRDWIIGRCWFPPCEEECNIQPVKATESGFTEVVLDKYCSLCWIKNGEGKCRGDSICYVLDVDFDADVDGSLESEYDYCIITCDKDTSSLFVQYQYLEKMIEIAC